MLSPDVTSRRSFLEHLQGHPETGLKEVAQKWLKPSALFFPIVSISLGNGGIKIADLMDHLISCPECNCLHGLFNLWNHHKKGGLSA